MRPLKPLLLLIISCFLIQSSHAQDERTIDLEFEEESFDFGDIEENGGDQIYKFEFTNTSDHAVKIENVQASCGCTTPSWTKEPVEPGEKGHVTAKFDPANRPGIFNKSLTITTDGQPKFYSLHIKGNVKKHEPTVTEKYPKAVDGLRMRTNYLNIGRAAPNGDAVTKSFEIYNETDSAVTFLPIDVKEGHFSVKTEPTILGPEMEGKIIVTYDATASTDYGTHYDPFTISTTKGKTLPLTLVAMVEDEPKLMSDEEYKLAPQLSFKKDRHNFGKIKMGEKVEFEFVFTNTGGKPVEIYKTKATCGCTLGKPKKTKLAPGESSQMTVSFDSNGKHPGPQSQAVTVFSSDPKRPTQRIMITGEVVN